MSHGGGRVQPVIEAAAQEPDDAGEGGEAPHSQLVVLLAAVGDVAFVAAVAVHVAFADGLGWAVTSAAVSALVFSVATIVALVARRKAVAAVATALIALAGLTAAGETVAAARRYDALRQEAFGDRGGVRLVEPDSAHGRRMGGAMLSSITASLAAITAIPLAGCLALRIYRTDRVP